MLAIRNHQLPVAPESPQIRGKARDGVIVLAQGTGEKGRHVLAKPGEV